MAKKKELDKLSLDMIQCKADGFGCNYGRWKSLQETPELSERKLPDGWSICPQCGKSFKLPNKGRKIYCEIYCQKQAQDDKRREINRKRQAMYRERRKAERNLQNEVCTG